MKCHWYLNCFWSRICPNPFVHISFGRIQISLSVFFFIVLIPRARFRCTTPGCQLFTSGRVQHKGRNQVTVNNTSNSPAQHKIVKGLSPSHYKIIKKAIVYYTLVGTVPPLRNMRLRPMRLLDNHRWFFQRRLY